MLPNSKNLRKKYLKYFVIPCLKLCVHLKVSFENAYFRECSQIICLLENNFRNFSFQIDDKKTHPKFLNSQNLINRFVLTLCCFSYSHFKLRHSRDSQLPDILSKYCFESNESCVSTVILRPIWKIFAPNQSSEIFNSLFNAVSTRLLSNR